MLNPPSFRSARLTYRPLEKDDADFVLEMLSDPYTQMTALGPPTVPYGKTKSEEILKAVMDATLAIAVCIPPATDDAKEEVIGWLRLSGGPAYAAVNRKATFGLSFKAGHQGKGYGVEAMEWLLETAFIQYGFNRLECEAFAWNEPANKLYKKLGFVEEGRKRQSLYQGGEFRDEVMYGMLAEEWRAQNKDKLQPN
ncbi:hypothetical protein JCM8097_000911 [Rhodosporidiobolus ruineniae]